MQQNDVLMLDLGLASPWKLLDQHLDIEASPNELQLNLGTERGTPFQCPNCAKLCPAHDDQQKKGGRTFNGEPACRTATTH